MDEISTERVAELLEAGEPPTLVDIREPPAFQRGHIPGSLNVPFGQLPDRVAELAEADHIVTVCPHGKASVQAAKLIESYEGTADATVQSMAGGLSEWNGAVEPSDDDAEPDEGPAAPF